MWTILKNIYTFKTFDSLTIRLTPFKIKKKTVFNLNHSKSTTKRPFFISLQNGFRQRGAVSAERRRWRRRRRGQPGGKGTRGEAAAEATTSADRIRVLGGRPPNGGRGRRGRGKRGGIAADDRKRWRLRDGPHL